MTNHPTSVGIVAITIHPLRRHIYGTTVTNYMRFLNLWSTFKSMLHWLHQGEPPRTEPLRPMRPHHLDVERLFKVDGDAIYLVLQHYDQPEDNPIKIELSTETAKKLLCGIFDMLGKDAGRDGASRPWQNGHFVA